MEVFDKSSDAGISFGLQSNQRMDRIPLFKEGGSGMLLVPSHLGYGSNDSHGIPGGSVLILRLN
jgi:FKBP-type peptidyl-prolyl cis-trans isomerase FkpA